MKSRLHFTYGWFHLGVYTYRIVPLFDGNYYSQCIYFFKVGTTPKEKEVLEKGL
jgi:hypothetical protein